MSRYQLQFISLLLLLAAPVVALLAGTAEPVDPTRAGHGTRVWVEGRRLVVEGLGPFVMRGVVWSPAGPETDTTPTAADNVGVRRSELGRWSDRDIPLLAAMHVNTVRLVMDPGLGPVEGVAGRTLLDRLHAAGIRVVMNVDDGVNDLARVEQVVTAYRDHPAVLLWMLGSEWNLNLYFGLAATPLDAAQRTERAAALVKRLDPHHPVAASLGDIHIDADGRRLEDTRAYVNRVCPSVDIWGLNVYRGRSFGDLFAQWAAISNKPMFLGEFGADAFHTLDATATPAGWIDEATQADWDLALWHEIRANLSADHPDGVAVGGTVFEWNDEWWKVPPAGAQDSGGVHAPGQQPDHFANEEWFGVVRIDRSLRPAYKALRDAFAADAKDPASPRGRLNVVRPRYAQPAILQDHAEASANEQWVDSPLGGAPGGCRLPINSTDSVGEDGAV